MALTVDKKEEDWSMILKRKSSHGRLYRRIIAEPGERESDPLSFNPPTDGRKRGVNDNHCRAEFVISEEYR